ncbi:hypothetical protein BGW37DRAFT_427467, partial [Umbelopsis sp. PMI_123]
IQVALTTVLQVLYPDRTKLANHEFFQSFFKAKTRTTVNMTKTEKLETWDLNIIITHLQTRYTNNDELPTYELQKKAIIQTFIATIWRPRSDVGRIQERGIAFTKDGNHRLTWGCVLIELFDSNPINTW